MQNDVERLVDELGLRAVAIVRIDIAEGPNLYEAASPRRRRER